MDDWGRDTFTLTFKDKEEHSLLLRALHDEEESGGDYVNDAHSLVLSLEFQHGPGYELEKNMGPCIEHVLKQFARKLDKTIAEDAKRIYTCHMILTRLPVQQ